MQDKRFNMKEGKRTTHSRKQFLRTIGTGTLGLAAGATACRSNTSQSETAAILTGKTYNWNMVTTWPPNFPVLGEGCNLFAQWVEEMSAGQLKIRVFGGGELIPALEAFDAVSSRTAEIGSGAAYYWAGKSPATQFFGAIPFGLNAQQVSTWLISGGGMKLWEEVYAQFNVIPLIGGYTGMQMGGWFNREINDMSDFRGLKMRMPGLGGKVLRKAGGTSVLSAGSEIYTNLERGVIDATEWIGPYHDYLMGFHQIADYYYYPGWHEPTAVLELFVNKLTFERLPVHLQQIIRAAAARVTTWMLCESELKNAEYLKKIREETDVEVRPFSQEILQTLQGYADEVLLELIESDPLSRKVYESFDSFKRKISSWSDISERIFYQSF